jgi:CelD/BcsL family acetyltransferase involved in cellulose biosynthesis
MRVETVTTAKGFADLRDAWDRLARGMRSSVFLRYDWFSAAWEWRRLDAELRILVAHEGDTVAAILPLVRLNGRRNGRRVWSLLTIPDTQCCDLIADAASVVASSRAIALNLAKRRDWDVLVLDYLPKDGMVTAHLAQELEAGATRAVTEDVGRNLYIPLDGTWEAYWATRSRSMKKASNLAANRLQREGTARIEHLDPAVSGAVELDRVLDAVIAISGRSWKQSTGNSLDRAGPGSFIRALSAAAGQHGWLSIWLAYLDEKPVAMEYQLVYQGKVHALRSDFDASLDRLSPGSFLFRHLIERLFAGKFAQYLMGPGDNAYKLRWSAEGHPLRRVTIYNRTAAGRLAHWIDQRAKPILRPLRDRLRGTTAAHPSRDSKTTDSTAQ